MVLTRLAKFQLPCLLNAGLKQVTDTLILRGLLGGLSGIIFSTRPSMGGVAMRGPEAALGLSSCPRPAVLLTHLLGLNQLCYLCP
jgi:hypothetical protein